MHGQPESERLPQVPNGTSVLGRPQWWGLIALLAVLFGLAFFYAYRQNGENSDDIVIVAGSDTRQSSSTGDEVENTIAVHVAGAVRNPGVYYLPRGSRVDDALKIAGGLTEHADPLGVNPAARLEDADQVIVPERAIVNEQPGAPPPSSPNPGEPRPAFAPRRAAAPKTAGKLRDPREGTININTASADELQRLPGVGPAIAARILTYRSQIGRFTSVDQLLDVSGIGEKKLAAMRPFVRVH